jgi:hypothetical protein
MIEGGHGERISAPSIPWNVRVALAFYDAGKAIPDHLLMCVQMLRNGEGCVPCRRQSLTETYRSR